MGILDADQLLHKYLIKAIELYGQILLTNQMKMKLVNHLMLNLLNSKDQIILTHFQKLICKTPHFSQICSQKNVRNRISAKPKLDFYLS